MSISGHITEFSCDLKLATQLCELLAQLQSVGFSPARTAAIIKLTLLG